MSAPDIAHLYPAAPANVPPDLTTSSGSYRLRVFVVLASLFAFLAVYLALTIGSAYLAYYCFATLLQPDPPPASTAPVNYRPGSPRAYSPPPAPRPRSEKPTLWLIVGGIASGLICLFMVKGFFKSSRYNSGVRVEVLEKDEPDLFAFIRKLCADTRAPFPHRVYVTPEVNAAVAYHESFLNLFLPARKNLIIGLGLVNRLNLMEFKAVLAHEFGHFSQKSMKLGTYVYTSNRAIGDVVFGRDALDDFIGVLRNIDIRIAIFAWGFTGILWLLRKLLEGLFRGINFANSSLSRQMEYNADLVAVSVTGSDALIFALARLDFAADTLGQAWTDLNAAADHGRFSRDLYFHQTRAVEFLRTRRGNPLLGEVPPLPDDPTQTVQVFQPEDTSVPAMWATHPANHDREVNAKARYVRGASDDRPAWALFRNGAAVREQVTRSVYEANRKPPIPALEDAEVVQAFIDAEHAETSYHPRYHGLYDNRYVKPGQLEELCERSTWSEYDDPAKLTLAHFNLYDGLKERMDAHKARHEEIDKLARLAHGGMKLRGSDFEHRGSRHQLAEARKLLKNVEEELDRDYQWMHLLDRAVFRVHYAMAAQLGVGHLGGLEERYRFHLALQDLYSQLVGHNAHVQRILAELSGQRQVAQEQFQAALASLRQAHDTLNEQLAVADGMLVPSLTNMRDCRYLGPFLLSEKLLKNLPAGTQSLEGAWIQRFMSQMGEVIDRTQRMIFKSLGGLLSYEESLAERWAAQHGEPTSGTVAESRSTAPAPESSY